MHRNYNGSLIQYNFFFIFHKNTNNLAANFFKVIFTISGFSAECELFVFIFVFINIAFLASLKLLLALIL